MCSTAYPALLPLMVLVRCSSDPECETCRGTTCVRCKEGLFIDDKGFCSPCLTLNCAACANATTCTACKPADFAASSGSNQAPLLYLDRKTGTCKPWWVLPALAWALAAVHSRLLHRQCALHVRPGLLPSALLGLCASVRIEVLSFLLALQPWAV